MKIVRILLSFVIAIYGSAAIAQAPDWPSEAPDDWLLAFVDVETTGLIPGYHEMIDIGIVMTDLDGAVKGKFFVRIQPDYPERTQDGARAVNAFDAERWKEMQALSRSESIERIVAFHNEFAGDKSVIMVAYNSHFDAAFLDHLFRAENRSWCELYHYFILDLPSMAWSQGLRDLAGQELTEILGIEDEPHVAEEHTGISGAEVNARIYRALLRRHKVVL